MPEILAFEISWRSSAAFAGVVAARLDGLAFRDDGGPVSRLQVLNTPLGAFRTRRGFPSVKRVAFEARKPR